MSMAVIKSTLNASNVTYFSVEVEFVDSPGLFDTHIPIIVKSPVSVYVCICMSNALFLS